MPGHLLKEEIVKCMETSANEFTVFCTGISNAQFFRQPEEKWSVAQNVTHLITSTKMTRLVYRLPKFVVRLYTGKPNRPSRSYDELVAKYQFKLAQGGRASGRFVAKPLSANEQKETIVINFTKTMESLINAVQKKWDDPQLDKYLAPHPLLGKLTLRELCYFTIYHTNHHLAIIKNRMTD